MSINESEVLALIGKLYLENYALQKQLQVALSRIAELEKPEPEALP